MADRRVFDAVKAELSAAIFAAAGRCGGGGGAFITDQDVADLRKDIADVIALGGSGGVVQSDILTVFPRSIPPTTQATFTLSVASAPTVAQEWAVFSSSDACVAPSSVTIPAGETSVQFKVTAGSPQADTVCTVAAKFESRVASTTCTVLHG